MELNILLRIPLLVIPFIFLVKYRESLVRAVTKIKLPKIVLALLVSVPLIIFEEHINCGAYGCTSVLIPPTLGFLLVMELIFFLLLKIIPLKSTMAQTVFIGILGIFFELLLGAAHGGFQSLIFTQPLVGIILSLWVGVSYVFVFFLPVLIRAFTPRSAGQA